MRFRELPAGARQYDEVPNSPLSSLIETFCGNCCCDTVETENESRSERAIRVKDF